MNFHTQVENFNLCLIKKIKRNFRGSRCLSQQHADSTDPGNRVTGAKIFFAIFDINRVNFIHRFNILYTQIY